jgi:alpha-L-fucosidase
VLTTRHEDGFCLWPTATTPYSVKSAPWKQGHGDAVREFVDACRRHGLQPGLYHAGLMDSRHLFQPGDKSAWYRDWFETTNRRLAEPGALERFTRMQCAQIRELLTGYGPIPYLWLDHIGETQGILDGAMVDAFWSAVVREVRACQPDCIVMKLDAWLCNDTEANSGYHGGRAPDPLWHVCRREDTPQGLGLPIPDPARGDQFVGWESNTIFSGGWFWDGEIQVKPVEQMVEHYYLTVGRGAVFLPNFAPDPRGRFTDRILRDAREFGDRIRRAVGRPLAETAGDARALELALPRPAAVDHILCMEDLREGQKIRGYRIDARGPDGAWREIVRGRSVAHKRIARVAPALTVALRFTCTDAFAPGALLRRFAAFATE